MDIRIVNTCNNNCLYCLEQSYRNKEEFLDLKRIFFIIENERNNNDDVITFYWGNALLHPDIEEIVGFCKEKSFTSIGILTNTYSLNSNIFQKLILQGLNSVGFYFNCFDETRHNLIVNGGMPLDILLSNIVAIQKSGIAYKAIIHINGHNINSLYRDIYILNKKYGVNNFEFINYFPHDRPYDEFGSILKYSIIDNRTNINKLFHIITKLELEANFVKFPKDFFWKYMNWYDLHNWILNQLGEEDRTRNNTREIPICLVEERCNSCFIKDANCKFYDQKV